MAVFLTFRIDVRPYSGYADPSLPIAAWIAQGSGIGDASGGTFTFEFRIHTDTDPQISQLYNLEQIAVDTSGTVDREIILQAFNMDSLAPNREVLDQRWQIQTLGAAATGFTALQADKATMLPLWLGAPNDIEGDAAIRLVLANTDLQLYLATLQGYLWGPRSILAEGGPQRPVSGLFGR